MAEPSIALPKTRSRSPGKNFLRFIPGILLLAGIGYLGKFPEQSLAAYGKSRQLHLPNVEYVLWAILIGLIVGNSATLPKFFRSL
jgi:hypothetical protein